MHTTFALLSLFLVFVLVACIALDACGFGKRFAPAGNENENESPIVMAMIAIKETPGNYTSVGDRLTAIPVMQELASRPLIAGRIVGALLIICLIAFYM
jgi:hypothetical protein